MSCRRSWSQELPGRTGGRRWAGGRGEAGRLRPAQGEPRTEPAPAMVTAALGV